MSPLQRLYSMFPNGWPGKGLLVLRLAGGLPLLCDAFVAVIGAPHRESHLLLTFAALAGVFFVVGLWTPVAGVCISIAELCMIFAGTDRVRVCLLQFTIGVSIAMLGPGAWSIDALLFGRRRLDLNKP